MYIILTINTIKLFNYVSSITDNLVTIGQQIRLRLYHASHQKSKDKTKSPEMAAPNYNN